VCPQKMHRSGGGDAGECSDDVSRAVFRLPDPWRARRVLSCESVNALAVNAHGLTTQRREPPSHTTELDRREGSAPQRSGNVQIAIPQTRALGAATVNGNPIFLAEFASSRAWPSVKGSPRERRPP
jgi:hypothetical protein